MAEADSSGHEAITASTFDGEPVIEGSVSPAGEEFQHTGKDDKEFFAENEKTFLSVVIVQRISCERTAPGSQGWGNSSEKGLSLIEELPCEIFHLILELLDISSMVSMASVNTNLRNMVQRLPDLKTVQQSIYSARALTRMYISGTAKGFTLADFVRAFSSSACGICGDGARFPARICLIQCRRMCSHCQWKLKFKRLVPVEMAKGCFRLTIDEICSTQRVFRAFLPPLLQCERAVDPLVRGRDERLVEVVSLQAAMKAAIHKHERSGGLHFVNGIVTDYLLKLHIFQSDADPYHDTCVPGFAKGLKTYWGKLGVEDWYLVRALITSVPYLHHRTFPPKIEPGIKCQGCLLEHHHNGHLYAIDTQVWVNMTTYLQGAFQDHLSGCQAAREIGQGKILTRRAESNLFSAVRSKFLSYFPDIENREIDMLNVLLWIGQPDDYTYVTAEETRAWYSRKMARIVEMGEYAMQYIGHLGEFGGWFEDEGGQNLDASVATDVDFGTFKFAHNAQETTANHRRPKPHSRRRKTAPASARIMEDESLVYICTRHGENCRKARKVQTRSEERFPLLALRTHFDSMPYWLFVKRSREVKWCGRRSQKLRDTSGWPRTTKLEFKAGAVDALAYDLQHLEICPGKVFAPLIWQMRSSTDFKDNEVLTAPEQGAKTGMKRVMVDRERS